MRASPDRISRELPDADREIAIRLAEGFTRVARQIRRSGAKELAPFGVTNAQARALRVVAAADAPMRMSDLAAHLDIAPRSATTMVDALERAGLVERSTDPYDRRSALVAESASGRRLFKRLESARRAAADDVFRHLSTSERQALLYLVEGLPVR